MFPLLFALQANPLFAWAVEEMSAGTRTSAVSIEKVFTANAKPTGAASIAFGAVHPAGRPRSSLFKMWTAARISTECATRIGPNSIARSHSGCVLDERLPDPSELLYHRLQQQSARESCTKYRFSTTIRRILYIVFDAHRSQWRNNIGAAINGLRSAVYNTANFRRLPNSYKKKVSACRLHL